MFLKFNSKLLLFNMVEKNLNYVDPSHFIGKLRSKKDIYYYLCTKCKLTFFNIDAVQYFLPPF